MENVKEIKVLDIIIALVKASKETPSNKNDEPSFYMNDGTDCLWGAKYLLGQVLRQYRIDGNHIFVSVAADNLWKEITDGKEEMENYHYTMGVPVHKEKYLELYKGAAKTPFNKGVFKEGNKFQYRQVFHDEHVIPIADVIEKLIALDDLNYENVKSVLNNIYMCRMLKSENIELNKGNRNKREWDVKKTIEEIYKEKHHIEIVGWEEIKNKL